MSDDNHTKVLAFLAGELVRDGHQLCVKVDLEYTPRTGFRREPIKSWTPVSHPHYFERAEGSHVFVNELTSEIMDLAENHADSYGEGRHRFTLRTKQHLGDRATCAFVCLPCASGDDIASAGGAMTGPANEDGTIPGGVHGVPGAARADALGLSGQLMRHLENRDRNNLEMMRTFLGAMGQSMQQLREENKDLRQQMLESDRDRRAAAVQIEEARSKDHERQVEAANVTSKNERTDYAMKKILALLPVAISGLVSNKDKSKKPGKQSALAVHMSKLFDSLSEDQRDHIEGVLDLEQKVLLGSLVRDVEDGGDSVLLPTKVQDLVSTLRPEQVRSVMGVLDTDQGKQFLQAMQLAQMQAQRNSDTPAPAKAEPEPETENA